MHPRGHRSGWAAAGISVAILLAGCTDSTPTAEPSGATPPSTTPSARISCDGIELRDVDVVLGDWALAEHVLVRGPQGTHVTVTLPADAPASVEMGGSPKSGTSETRTTGLTVAHATAATDPITGVDPATLLAAIGQPGSDPLALTNSGQGGFTGELEAQLGAAGAVVFRGAKEAMVTFAGDCSDASGDSVPVTGSARYFALAETGILDCGKPAEAGTLGEVAAEFCATD